MEPQPTHLLIAGLGAVLLHGRRHLRGADRREEISATAAAPNGTCHSVTGGMCDLRCITRHSLVCCKRDGNKRWAGLTGVSSQPADRHTGLGACQSVSRRSQTTDGGRDGWDLLALACMVTLQQGGDSNQVYVLDRPNHQRFDQDHSRPEPGAEAAL